MNKITDTKQQQTHTSNCQLINQQLNPFVVYKVQFYKGNGLKLEIPTHYNRGVVNYPQWRLISIFTFKLNEIYKGKGEVCIENNNTTIQILYKTKEAYKLSCNVYDNLHYILIVLIKEKGNAGRTIYMDLSMKSATHYILLLIKIERGNTTPI